MQTNFARSLDAVLLTEGGFVNDPQDSGGATNKGITQNVYDAYRTKCALPHQSVMYISALETAAIYKSQYWDKVNGDSLPEGLDYATFDFAINSGVGRATRYLQAVVGVPQDGNIGPATLAAIQAHGVTKTIDDVCARRLAFLEQLPNFGHFPGWVTRDKAVDAEADKEASEAKA